MNVDFGQYINPQSAKSNAPFDLSKLSEGELLALRLEIDRYLPTQKLKDIDLEKEAILQLRRAQILQEEVLTNQGDTPVNQQAQLLNSVSANLQELNKMQEKYYNANRFKRIEAMLVNMLNTWEEGQTRLFFEAYEKLLSEG